MIFMLFYLTECHESLEPLISAERLAAIAEKISRYFGLLTLLQGRGRVRSSLVDKSAQSTKLISIRVFDSKGK